MDKETLSHELSVAQQSLPRDAVRLPKKLIICCDGTWQDSDNGWVPGSWGRPGHLQTPTNVTRICRAIKPEDDRHHPQIVYYQAGIGSGLGLYNHLVGGGTGVGLSENIREAYAFVASNYNPQEPGVDPDSIFLLGFSRGAFTARSLGGFIGAIGVLTKAAMPFFYQCFLDWENAGNPSHKPLFIDAYVAAHPDKGLSVKDNQPPLSLARDFKSIDKYMYAYRKHLLSLGLTQEVKIKCIGVWDTVGALGIPVNPVIQRVLPFLNSFIREYRWFDTRLDNCVENAFQALGLDEERFPFSPSVWEKDDSGTTNMKQVWFPGAHSNIGGSYDDTGMANITLAWMMDQLSGNTRDPAKEFRAVDWIKFDDTFIDRWQKHNADYYGRSTDGKFYKGWGMGKVYDSDTFPQSVLGRKTRSPGTYHRTDYITGKPSSEYLQNTNEHIHSSVRARVDLAGRGVEAQDGLSSFVARILQLFGLRPSNSLYQPQRPKTFSTPRGPLHGWRLKDGHDTHHEPNMNIATDAGGLEHLVWAYEGAETPDLKSMPEDRMAPNGFEHQLLKHDEEIASKIIFSNNRWQTVAEQPKQEIHPAKTF